MPPLRREAIHSSPGFHKLRDRRPAMVPTDHAAPVDDFDLTGLLRRIRRRADLSQRELAAACGVAQAVIAQAESGRRGMAADLLARAAVVARLRLVLVDDGGAEVPGMTNEGARDRGRRRLPAHLDSVRSDRRPGRYQHRPSRPEPTYTVDRDRRARDELRARDGTPDDHHVPQPGDSPAERQEARRREWWRRRAEAQRRWLETQQGKPFDPGFVCECPPRCDELDDHSGKPVHADDCPCGCDVD
jgi:transcriptional regulator with XRE-family HTH domain